MERSGLSPLIPAHRISTSQIIRSFTGRSTGLMSMLAMGCMFPDEEALAIELNKVVFPILAKGESAVIDGMPRFANQVGLLRSWSASCRVLVVHPPAGTLARYLSIRRAGEMAQSGHPVTDFSIEARRSLWYGRQFHEVVKACHDMYVRFDFGWSTSELNQHAGSDLWISDISDWLTQGGD
jgi:hypothetical protein